MIAWYRQAEERGISLSPAQIEKLTRFASIVLGKGVLLGLSGRKNLDEIHELDILDSLILYPHAKEAKNALEIGSGAGFPGIPLKILLPETSFVLADAKKKAARFLQEVVDELSLSKVVVVWGRAEEMGGSFDSVFGRAVAPMDRLFEMARPLVAIGGRIFFQKGSRWKEEITKAEPLLKKHGFDIESIADGLMGQQKIVIVKRER